MSHPIKLIIKKGSTRKDGTCIIFIQYCYSAEDRVLVDSGVAVPPKYWNRKTSKISTNLPQEFGDVDELQNRLTCQLRKAEDIIAYALKKRNTCPLKFLKENFHFKFHRELEQSIDNKNLDVF